MTHDELLESWRKEDIDWIQEQELFVETMSERALFRRLNGQIDIVNTLDKIIELAKEETANEKRKLGVQSKTNSPLHTRLFGESKSED